MELKSTVISSIKWVMISRITVQIIRWLVTFWTIRLLTPDDYGLFAIADFFLSFLWLFATSGSGSAVIQSKNTSKNSLRELYFSIILMNITFFIILFISSSFIAEIYSKPILEEIIKVAAVTFLIITFQIIPSALISKEMDFKKTTYVEIFSQLVCSISILYMAFNGFGVWTLVYGEIILLSVQSIILYIISPQKITPKCSFTEVKELASFGGKISIVSLLGHLNYKVDILIAGAFLTAHELGQYQIALVIASIPLSRIVPSIRRVAFPAFSKIQDDLSKIRNYLLKSIRLGSYILFPLFFGIAATSSVFVPLILGENWLSAIIPIAIVSLSMPFRFCNEMFSPAIKSLGKANLLLYTMLISLLIATISVSFGINFGVIGLSYSWLVSSVITFFVFGYIFPKTLSMSLRKYFTTTLTPLIYSLVMLIVLDMLKATLISSLLPLFQLLIMVLVGSSIYVLCLLIFEKALIKEFKNLLTKRPIS